MELPFGGLVTSCKGGDAMITWSEIFLFAAFVVALITLLKNKDK
jgi:hypothetical protein